MVQKKGKNDKSSSDDAAHDSPTLILDYLRKQNRPYSATEISANLHNKITKAHAAKDLRELHRNKQIEGRAAGKQVVYHAIQDTCNEATPEIIASLDWKTERLQEQVTSLQVIENKTRAELAAICGRPLVSELRRDIDQFEQEQKLIRARLNKVRGSDLDRVPVQHEVNAEKDWNHWQNQANIRRRICRDLWRKCSEVMPENMTREELWESLGLEGSFLN